MSSFSDVDAAVGAHGRLVAFLDRTARAEAGIKHYVAAAHAIREPRRPILDLGCGAGHDVALLASAGLRTVGLDPSAVLLATARSRVTPALAAFVRGTGEQLPFPGHAFSGCRIERVLMHVVSPGAVVAEVVRCLEPGALLTIFEPDWSQFTVSDRSGDRIATWLLRARHPGVGGELVRLVEQAGCTVLDRVEERSYWPRLETLDYIVGGTDRAVERAIEAGRIRAREGRAWLADQRARDERGEFHAVMPKILVVARRGAAE
jgi:SAM-dependent methyltransferase